MKKEFKIVYKINFNECEHVTALKIKEMEHVEKWQW